MFPNATHHILQKYCSHFEEDAAITIQEYAEIFAVVYGDLRNFSKKYNLIAAKDHCVTFFDEPYVKLWEKSDQHISHESLKHYLQKFDITFTNDFVAAVNILPQELLTRTCIGETLDLMFESTERENKHQVCASILANLQELPLSHHFKAIVINYDDTLEISHAIQLLFQNPLLKIKENLEIVQEAFRILTDGIILTKQSTPTNTVDVVFDADFKRDNLLLDRLR